MDFNWFSKAEGPFNNGLMELCRQQWVCHRFFRPKLLVDVVDIQTKNCDKLKEYLIKNYDSCCLPYSC